MVAVARVVWDYYQQVSKKGPSEGREEVPSGESHRHACGDLRELAGVENLKQLWVAGKTETSHQCPARQATRTEGMGAGPPDLKVGRAVFRGQVLG